MTAPARSYGNDQPWPEHWPESVDDQPTCDHPDKKAVTVGGYWRKQYGYIPRRRVWQCVECGAELGKVVEP